MVITEPAPEVDLGGDTTATVDPEERLGAIFDELAELAGQQNAIAGRIAELLGTIEADGLLGFCDVRSLEHLATWKLGLSPGRARSLCAIARRRRELPETTALLDEGTLSEDQVAVIARRAPAGTDTHYAELARSATVSQLRTAMRVAPTPDVPSDLDEPATDTVESRRQVRAWFDEHDRWHLTAELDAVEGAQADNALRAHLDALMARFRRDRDAADCSTSSPPLPTLADAFVRLCGHGLDAEAAARPHAHRTTVVVHLDVARRAAEFHLGPVLTEAERRYLTCDARFEVWFERDGVPIGAGRSTREISRRLRHALERRDRSCRVPGCGSTAGLHAHHIVHWEDGGSTELHNLVLVCPFHHRLHHRGRITISGTGADLHVQDRHHRPVTGGGLARPPTTPRPAVPPYPHPTGERFQRRWYIPPSLS